MGHELAATPKLIRRNPPGIFTGLKPSGNNVGAVVIVLGSPMMGEDVIVLDDELEANGLMIDGGERILTGSPAM